MRTAGTSLAGLVVLGAMLMGAAPAPKAPPSPQDILDAAPAGAWKAIDADDLVIMTLADGNSVVYQLAPRFAPVHVANIRQLVRSGYFDGAVILRVQDGYVVQWGRPDEDRTEAKGIEKHSPAEYDFPAKGAGLVALPWPDSYAKSTGHIDGWPAASDLSTITRLFVGTNALGIWDELFFICTCFALLRRHLVDWQANLVQAVLFTSFLWELGFHAWGPLLIYPFALVQGWIFRLTKSLTYIVCVHLLGLTCELQPFVARCGLDGLVAVRAQNACIRVTRRRVVVDDQDLQGR